MATETATSQAKKKNGNAAPQATASAPKTDALTKSSGSEFEVSSQTVLREEDFKEVDFNRIWYRTKKNQNPLSFLVLAKSKDMRGEFKSKYPGDKSPCYMYACEAMHDVSAADQTLFSGEEPIAVARGEVFYMIAPKRCFAKLEAARQAGFIARLQALQKVEVESRDYGKVFAWDYKLSIRPQVTVTVVDVPALMMPVAEELEAVEEE